MDEAIGNVDGLDDFGGNGSVLATCRSPSAEGLGYLPGQIDRRLGDGPPDSKGAVTRSRSGSDTAHGKPWRGSLSAGCPRRCCDKMACDGAGRVRVWT